MKKYKLIVENEKHMWQEIAYDFDSADDAKYFFLCYYSNKYCDYRVEEQED